jgi:hypothetical protein
MAVENCNGSRERAAFDIDAYESNSGSGPTLHDVYPLSLLHRQSC